MPGLTVAVVGDGWWAEEIRREAQELGVADIVEFLGFVPEEVKHQQLRKAWVLALPSLKEGWGLAITEAASHGVPSVAYRSAGGVTESIIEGESGVLVDGSEADFVEALRAILTDDDLRARLSAGAHRRAAGLSWQSTAQGFSRILGEVLDRPVPVGTAAIERPLLGQHAPGGPTVNSRA